MRDGSGWDGPTRGDGASDRASPGKATLARKLEPVAGAGAGTGASAGPKVGAQTLAGGLAEEAAPGGAATAAAPGSPAEAVRLARTGQRIQLPFRGELEAELHRDLSLIEAFAGPAATEACAGIGAEAFTVGSTIAFCSPSPPMETVRHEVAHVLQQGGDRATVGAPADLGMTAPGSAEEHEAEAAERGAGEQAVSAAPPQAAMKPMLAMKPGKDSFCKTTATFDLVAVKGGPTQGRLPGGSLVQVTGLEGTGYNIEVKSVGSWAGKTGYLPNGALADAQGIIDNTVYNEGRIGGTLDGTGTMINCLGHASGQKRAAYITNGTTEDMLKGLGFTCILGDSSVLAPYIKQGKYAMMVYMYMYKPSLRSTDDQPLSWDELQKKYGWSAGSWRQPNVYFGPKGEDQPIDYHALDYNATTKKWEWVSHNRARDKAPSYDVDSKGTEPAALNPDDYFGGSGQVLVSIACYK